MRQLPDAARSEKTLWRPSSSENRITEVVAGRGLASPVCDGGRLRQEAVASRSGSSTGRSLHQRGVDDGETAELAPMPSASARIAAAAKPGLAPQIAQRIADVLKQRLDERQARADRGRSP